MTMATAHTTISSRTGVLSATPRETISLPAGARVGGFSTSPDEAAPVRKSARRGRSKGNVPSIPLCEVWLDVDVAEYLHVSLRLVKRIMADGAKPGEIDLRRANPVFVGDLRRWYADNVKALLRDGVVGKAKI